MISANNISLQFGKRVLFDKVNAMFTAGNCYGIIGANGSGKSTFLKILSGELESTAGDIAITTGERISVLKQDQFAFDKFTVLETVIQGHKELYKIMKEKDAIYAKSDFSDKDGIRAGELEEAFNNMNGWEAESEAAKLLCDLGVETPVHSQKMAQLEGTEKLRVLLAQALFGNPDILLLDEPTNQLDVETTMWLENFLYDFKNTAIVVSHDRHFLDKVCTHIADIDYGKIQLYSGNYSFWRDSSELALQQRSDKNKKTEEKRKDLQAFIARFSANAAKSRQATARKKMLEKLTIEDIRPSSRKYPFISFAQDREAGNDILEVQGINKTIDGQVLLTDFSLRVNKGDKIAFFGPNDLAKSALFQILMDEIPADSGSFKCGASTSRSHFPKDNQAFFDSEKTLIEWLQQFSHDTSDNFIRGFLGRMLFSGEEALKKVNVLSGGERVRLMLSRMMLKEANLILLDEPTDHLDLESITALNRGLERFPGTILFASRDHELVQTVANRIVEITPHGVIDEVGTKLDDYLTNPRVKEKRQQLYSEVV